ncbi:MAG: efflux RND transporter periplasmic adaptor subunit [Gammaproteobacteria bacterium]|nr:efflux RND transporter periplasmic adaptor subunit [Gammaproteobacteria bacterium]
MYKKVLPILIIVAAIVVSALLRMSRPDAEQNDPLQLVVTVDAISVAVVDSYITVPSQGTVEPRTRTNLVSEVAGQVVEVSPAFVAGGFFREGDVLVKLEDQDYRAAVRRAEASVASARSLLEQEKGQADVAQREWDRMTAQEQSRIRARELYLRKPQLEEARARLASAEADLEQAMTDLAKTTITAPYDGLVSAKNTDIGQFVTTGASIAETFAVDYAEVRLPVPETKISFLDLPPATGYKNDDYAPEVDLVSRIGNNEYHWNGKLTRTEGVLDTRTRVLFSVVQIEDPYNLYSNEMGREPLRIGTYVNAAIQGRLLEDVVVLPRYTLQSNNIIWTADNEGRLRPKTVEVLTINGDNVYISSGLKDGDQVVITRLENPLNGMQVQVNIAEGTIQTVQASQ